MDVMYKRFKLKKHGTKFWTRRKGVEIREILDGELQKLHDREVIIIDLEGVEVFDVSFAAEFFLKTSLKFQSEYKGRFVVIENIAEHCRETLSDKLEKESHVMIELVDNKLRLIGKVNPKYQETVDAISSVNLPVPSSELADVLGVNLNAMNERLRKLAELALIRREKGVSQAGREEFLYSSLI